MVSELSARLMRGNSHFRPAPTTSALQSSSKAFADYTVSANRSSVVVSPNPIAEHEPMMTISACTQKLDQISTKTKKLARKTPTAAPAPVENGCFKRRKVDELQFAAARVKDDLTKGGLSYPGLDTSLRHHLDLDRAEDATRGVSLVCSKSVGTSPFLTQNGSKCSEMASMCDFGSLFSATYDCYSKPSSSTVSINSSGATFVSNSDSGSICSLTSEKSEPSFIAPRLEDALNNKKIKVEETPQEKEALAATARQRRAIYSNPITIRDAFENSDEARIVTLSFAPFLVAHVNPAYTRITGLTPADILGKPFHEMIEDPTCKANTTKASSLTGLHEKVTSFVHTTAAKDADEKKLAIKVAVVGPESAANTGLRHVDYKSFTHYMISLVEHEEPPTESDDESLPQAMGTVTPEHPSSPAVGPTANATSLAVPPLPILEPSNVGIMPTMRLHCGVMG